MNEMITITSLKELYEYLNAKIESKSIIEAQFRNNKIELEVYKLEKKIKRLESIVFVNALLSIGLYAALWIIVLKG